MMKLTEFLTKENIRQGVIVSSKKRALELIGKIVADSLNNTPDGSTAENICAIECFSHLFKREKLGSTSINGGIALPHAKLPASTDSMLTSTTPISVFLQLENGIDYEASDNKEVDLIYAIMLPSDCCDKYKDDLPALAEKLSDKSLAKQLRAATSSEEIWQYLEYADHQIEPNE
ncbi:PTS sugar transporter subunit IIA [[Haemophilus] ducreyi]|uniref:PTS sugar transporter subunit IIA n=1 Tax=Haemophilus ducreyi TaxID=730 RepID=UPI000654E38A|nr:PTS sugar transporter subunit IIA [[Haemophilus] ducreyi]AKO45076.1 PTS sugar transporter subunit IIA [[Haemophilus] ducreyi]AKO46478.1 PTS sugar transporter subunit IIA [[Haemophilus] ducreyi]AKO47820.1 PTS sugar transporter subunit IIA [[Haemophilus] ducreyi]AKO49207.1 PTS sugar transporter subunit IIA [[Haemophilus] ducreyi]ANF62257.1 PTS sugar transporter subunit IIA [[Haemophilus] ducreyi]